MKTPAFWYPDPGVVPWQARALAPLAALYAFGTRRRVAQSPRYTPECPVICVGNIHAGGMGKTPTVIALAELAKARGLQPVILSRGYGGQITAPHRVQPTDKAEKVGDEPLLMAAFAPVWVADDRVAGAKAAAEDAPDVLILDDGFQDPSLFKTLSLVVVDGAVGFGNGRVIPAGPLREPVSEGLARADAVVCVRGETTRTLDLQTRVLDASLEPLPTGLPWAGVRVLAFAGIGRPQKFFATLRGLGAEVIRTVPLGDHQPLTPALMTRLETEAKARSAQLVTTEKDAVRLPASFRQKVTTLPVRLRFEDEGALDAFLAPIFTQPQPATRPTPR